MESSQFPRPSRKNSNEESQVSTREQLNAKEDPPPPLQLSRQIHTHQLEVSPLGTSSHHANSLMLHEDTIKPTRDCPLTDKRTTQLEWQLRGERHKVARLRQIIRVKTQKQSQLQKAYFNIAIELKKKMQASTSARSKISEPDTTPPPQSQTLLSRLGSQVESLEREVKRLTEDVEYWRGESERKVAEAMGSQIAELLGRESKYVGQEKLMNVFYVKEIERLQTKVGELEFQLNLKTTVRKPMEFSQAQIERICNLHNSASERREQRSQESDLLQDKRVVSSGNVGEGVLPQNSEQFESFSQGSPLMEKKLQFSRRQNRESEIPQPQPPLASPRQLPPPEDLSLMTANDPVDDSFQSIHSKPEPSKLMHSDCERWSDLNLESSVRRPSNESSQFHSIPDGPQFLSVSNVLSQLSHNSSLNESLRSILCQSAQKPAISEQMVYEIPHPPHSCQSLPQQVDKIQRALKLELERCQQKMNRFRNEVQRFLSRIAGQFNEFTEQLFTGQPHTDLSIALRWKRRENDPENILSTDQIERFVADLEQQLSKTARWNRNRYEKLANDRELEQWQSKSKLQSYDAEIDQLRQKVQFLLQYNRKLEFEVAELSSLSPGKHPSEHAERLSYMRAMYRSKISMAEPVADQPIQCDLLPSNSAQLKAQQTRANNYKSALVHLTDQINKIIQRSKTAHEPYIIDFDGCLRMQIDRMLENAFDAINNYSPSKRRPSISLENSPKKLVQTEEVDEVDMLMAENEQLRAHDTEKSERITQLKSAIQKQKKQLENSERLVEQLRHQIEHMHANVESRVASTPPQLRTMSPSQPERLEQVEFMDFSVIREFNNMNWDKDEQMRLLRNELKACQEELQKQQKQGKRAKKHIFYVSN